METKNKLNEHNVKTIPFMIILIIVLLIFVTGTAFSIINIVNNAENPIKEIKTDILEAEYVETDMFDIKNAHPMIDSEGLKEKPLKFNLTNTGTADMTYQVKLVELNSEFSEENILSKSNIKYSMFNTKDDFTRTYIKSFGKINNNVLYEGTINAKEKINFDLRVWLKNDDQYIYDNKAYLFKLKIEAGLDN